MALNSWIAHEFGALDGLTVSRYSGFASDKLQRENLITENEEAVSLSDSWELMLELC
jgi:hypothetical protein